MAASHTTAPRIADHDRAVEALHEAHVVLDDQDRDSVAAWISRIRSAVLAVSATVMPAVGSSSKKKPRLAREQHGDLEPLFLAVREDAGRLRRVLREAKAREQFPTIAAPGGTAEQTEQAAPGTRGDQRHLEVLGDREARMNSRHLELARDPEPADLVRPGR